MKKMISPLKTQHGVRYEFIEAVEGQQLSPAEIERRYDDAKARSTLGRSLTAGEVGCVLSHLKVYQRIVEQNLPQAFVLEDDIHFSPHFISTLEALGQTELSYEIILFAHSVSKLHSTSSQPFSFWGKISLCKPYSLRRFWRLSYGALGYLITRAAAEKLLKALSPPRRFFQPLDHYTGNPRLVNLYGVAPVVIAEAPVGVENSTLAKERDKERERKNDLEAKIKHFLQILLPFNSYYWFKFLYFFFRSLLPPPTPKK